MNAMKACWEGGCGGTVPLILKIKRNRGFHLTPKKLYSSHSLNRLLRGLQGRSNLTMKIRANFVYERNESMLGGVELLLH